MILCVFAMFRNLANHIIILLLLLCQLFNNACTICFFERLIASNPLPLMVVLFLVLYFLTISVQVARDVSDRHWIIAVGSLCALMHLYSNTMTQWPQLSLYHHLKATVVV